MLKPPYDVIPTNSKVKLEGAITVAIAKTQSDLAKIRTIDWDKLNPQRGALIDRFNREIGDCIRAAKKGADEFIEEAMVLREAAEEEIDDELDKVEDERKGRKGVPS